MRFVFAGATDYTEQTAELLIKRGHDVVIIDANRERIDELSETLDCSFLHGDGSAPHILSEADPEATDILFCLAESDKDNIIAGLVGRSLGFKRVVTSIEAPEYEKICVELGLEDVIVPPRTIGRYLADMARGIDVLELSSAIRGEVRLFKLIIPNDDEGNLDDLDLPSDSIAICVYRNDEFSIPKGKFKLKKDDEVVLLTHSRNIPDLRERWLGESRK